MLCFADILDKLEVKILEEEGSRTQSIDAILLKKKLYELKEQIKRDVQNDPQLSNLNEGLLCRMRSTANEAERRLQEVFGDNVEFQYPIFGEFVPGSKPKVVIYYKSIKNNIGRFESCWAVMAAVFVHEMFHAWNYFNAGQKSRSILAIDEPMVEFETLYFLKELEAFTQSQSHHLKDKVSSVKTDRKYRVQNKQRSIGDVAAYGFGYYLFDKLSRSNVDSRRWIETYSKKSAYIDGSHLLVNNVKDALIPIYPFTSQDKVMESFKNIIFGRQATYVTVGKSTSDKIGQDVSLRDLVLACIKTIGRKCFDAKELYAFAPIFKVCIPQFENLENTLKSQLDELVEESLLNALPDDCYSIKSSIEVKPTSAPTLTPTLTPAPTKSKGSYTKDPSIPFVVEFPDDNVIFNEKQAVKTFIKSLKHIGLSNVQRLNIMIRGGYNLISDDERPREGKNKWQDYVDDKYIYTKLGNPEKITYLYRIAKELGININIYDI